MTQREKLLKNLGRLCIDISGYGRLKLLDAYQKAHDTSLSKIEGISAVTGKSIKLFEGYHLKYFAYSIPETALIKPEKGQKTLEKALTTIPDGIKISTINTIGTAKDHKFSPELARKIFDNLAEVQGIHVLACLLQFLEYCQQEGLPLRSFDSKKLSDTISELKTYLASIEIEDDAPDQLLMLPPNPYKGFSAFGEADVNNFYGRENETEALCLRLECSRFLALVGVSGSGKSSLAAAGIIPRLRIKKNWYCLPPLRLIDGDSNDPMLALATLLVDAYNSEISASEYTDEIEKTAARLSRKEEPARVLKILAPKILGGTYHKLLIYIDQFEEIFFGDIEADKSSAFIRLLSNFYAKFSDTDKGLVTILITMRNDFLAQAHKNSALIPLFDDKHIYNVSPINGAELQEVIEEPAKPVRFQDGLVARIIKDAAVSSSSLSLIGFSLSTLWERQTNNAVNFSHYEVIGGVSGAFSTEVKRHFQRLSIVQQEQAEHILIQLVGRNEGRWNVKRVVNLNQFDKKLWPLINVLSNPPYRLLVIKGNKEDNSQTVELIHDALITEWSMFGTWIVKHKDFLRRQDELSSFAKPWLENPHSKNLLSGDTLAVAKQHYTDDFAMLASPIKKFILQSIQKEKRAKKTQFISVVTIMIVLLFLSGLFYELKNEADSKNKRLVSEISAQLLEKNETRLSILTALIALEDNYIYGERDEISYRRALNILKSMAGKYVEIDRIPLPQISKDLRAYDLTSDFKLLAYVDGSKGATVWDMELNRVKAKFIDTPNIIDTISFDKSGDHIIITSHDGEAGQIWNIHTKTKLAFVERRDVENMVLAENTEYFSALDRQGMQTVSYIDKNKKSLHEVISANVNNGEYLSLSPDGCCVIFTERGKVTKYRLNKDKKEVSLSMQDKYNSVFAISPNQRFIIAHGEDGKLRYEDLNTFLLSGQLREANYSDDIEIDLKKLIFNETGHFFAFVERYSYNPDGKAHIFHTATGSYLSSPPFGYRDYIHAKLSISPITWDYLNHGSYDLIGKNMSTSLFNVFSGLETSDRVFDNLSIKFGQFERYIDKGLISVVNRNSNYIEIWKKLGPRMPHGTLLPFKYTSFGVSNNEYILAKLTKETSAGIESSETHRWKVSNGKLNDVTKSEIELDRIKRPVFSAKPSSGKILSYLYCENKTTFDRHWEINLSNFICVDFDFNSRSETPSSSQLIVNNLISGESIILEKKVSKEAAINSRFSDDGNLLYIKEGETLTIYNLKFKPISKRSFTLTNHSTKLLNVIFREEPFAILHDNNNIEVIQLKNKRTIFSAYSKDAEISTIKWMDKLNALAWTENQNKIKIQDVFTNEILFEYEIGSNRIEKVDVNPESLTVFWQESDGSIYIVPMVHFTERSIINSFRELKLPPLTEEEKSRFHLE